jgi:hypothetical protein
LREAIVELRQRGERQWQALKRVEAPLTRLEKAVDEDPPDE